MKMKMRHGVEKEDKSTLKELEGRKLILGGRENGMLIKSLSKCGSHSCLQKCSSHLFFVNHFVIFCRDDGDDWRSNRDDSSKFNRHDGDTDWRANRNAGSKFSRDDGSTDWRSDRNNSSKFSRDEDIDWRSNRENSLKFNSRKFNDEKFEDNSSTFAGRTLNNKKLESPRKYCLTSLY